MKINEFDITVNDRDDLEIWKDMLKKREISLKKKDRIEKLKKIEFSPNPISSSFIYDYWQDVFDKAELRKLRIEKLNKLNND